MWAVAVLVGLWGGRARMKLSCNLSPVQDEVIVRHPGNETGQSTGE